MRKCTRTKCLVWSQKSHELLSGVAALWTHAFCFHIWGLCPWEHRSRTTPSQRWPVFLHLWGRGEAVWLGFADVPQPCHAILWSPSDLCSIYFPFHFKMWVYSEGKPIHVFLNRLHLISSNSILWHPWASQFLEDRTLGDAAWADWEEMALPNTPLGELCLHFLQLRLHLSSTPDTSSSSSQGDS